MAALGATACAAALALCGLARPALAGGVGLRAAPLPGSGTRVRRREV